MTPLVLLPGMMCGARLFAPQIAAFEAERDVLVPNIGGHNTMEELASAVLAEAPEIFALAGLSMGGIVAMEILRQAPERIERLALLDTNPLAELPEVQARRATQIKAALNGNLEAVMREDMKPNYLVDSPDKPALLDLCMAMALDLGAEVFVRQSQALRSRIDQTDTLCGLKVPALVLCGRYDLLCPVARHKMMATIIPGAEFHIVENAGHLPTLEQPEETTAAMRRWLARF